MGLHGAECHRRFEEPFLPFGNDMAKKNEVNLSLDSTLSSPVDFPSSLNDFSRGAVHRWR